MSCLNPEYNPIPTHIGYRVENRCITDTEYPYNNNSSVYIPQLNSNNNINEIEYIKKSLYKGNILQYKKNSSNLTKAQRYTQIIKGCWVNRTKTWATQSQTYTNNNTNSLKRITTNENITLSGDISYLPSTCGNLPENQQIIQNGGVLLCNSIENKCNGYSYTSPNNSIICTPNTDSNIPGKPSFLCYPKSMNTYYPKTRYIMNNSMNKWPVNAKGLCKSANNIKSFCETTPNLIYSNTLF